MKGVFVTLGAVLAVAFCKSVAVEDFARVQVFYESLCPGSRQFIKNTLYPTFQLLGKDLMHLEFVPYGFATEEVVNGTINFTCQHGPDECNGNLVQVCVINSTSIEKTADFIYCAETSSAPGDNGIMKQCAESVGLDWSALQSCVASGKADALLHEKGEKTAAVNPIYLPFVVVDGVWTEDNQLLAVTGHLKDLVCNLTGNRTAECL